MRVLYAGDGKLGEASRYLLAVLRSMRATVAYVPSRRKLALASVRRKDVLILSDYGYDRLSPPAEEACVEHIRSGRGFLMIGGWGSFSAKYGNWHRSRLAEYLPVSCLGHDDRTNIPTGALVVPKAPHPMFKGLSWKQPPVVCGLNHVKARPEGRILWQARPIHPSVDTHGGTARVSLSGALYPLLAIHRDPKLRIAAFTSDVAPHWCGGLVDWGRRRLSLSATDSDRVEVGDQYVQFLSSLIRWLAEIS